MVGEPEAETVTAEQAMLLLLLSKTELKRLEREGAFSPMASGRYWLKDLVQGYVRHTRKPAAVSASELAVHFGCVRSYVAKLIEQGVIERRGDGKLYQDQCRTKYLAHLREERKRSPKSEADVAFQTAKTSLIQLRIDEKRRTLVRRDEHEAMIDTLAGLTLTKLGQWPARIAGTDLVLRRRAEALLRELRVEMSQAATALADEAGEPELDAA